MRVKILLFILISSFVANSQEIKKDSVTDLRVGLVLSGGGAKGIAHVGVLKALEELGFDLGKLPVVS